MMQGADGLVAEKKGKSAGERGSRRKPPEKSEAHVADALRVAYEETVRETVPDEFIDLLGKLS